MEDRRRKKSVKEGKAPESKIVWSDGSGDESPTYEKGQLLARLDEMKRAIDGYKELRGSSKKKKKKSSCNVDIQTQASLTNQHPSQMILS